MESKSPRSHQEELAPWRSPLQRALHRNRSLAYARYLQLATVRPDGRPANRTVVFRGFLEGSDCLTFITDARSPKVEQIAADPRAEVCWYFPKTREQFRLSGLLMVIDEDYPDPQLQASRQRLWQDISEATREQFCWPQPGRERTETAFKTEVPDPIAPLANFCLLLLDPETVDRLELRGSPQNRWIYNMSADRSWSVREVNP